MKLVDANVLLYAVNTEAMHHTDSFRWLEDALNGGDVVGFGWNALLAFLRLSTHPTIFPSPLSAEDGIAQIDAWLSSPHARALEPGPGHLSALTRCLAPTGAGGNLVNDAHLAALAMEHRATIVTYDSDFARFTDVTWRTPTQLVT